MNNELNGIQPKLKIGIMAEAEINFCLHGSYLLNTNGNSNSGKQVIRLAEGKIHLNGHLYEGTELRFEPIDPEVASFELFNVTIGVQFHWERKEDQLFRGALQFLLDKNKIQAINILPFEDYLISVISSEMSATSSLELLKAHAMTSRSWLLAQFVKG